MQSLTREQIEKEYNDKISSLEQEMLKLCPHCNCMTKEIKGKCGKCGMTQIDDEKYCVVCHERLTGIFMFLDYCQKPDCPNYHLLQVGEDKPLKASEVFFSEGLKEEVKRVRKDFFSNPGKFKKLKASDIWD